MSRKVNYMSSKVRTFVEDAKFPGSAFAAERMEREPGTPLENPKHEIFAQGIAKGLTLGEAYAAAGYVEDRGNAFRLQQMTTVKDRIKELTAEAVVRHGFETPGCACSGGQG